MSVKPTLFTFLFLTLLTFAYGQSSDKYLKRLNQDAGTLYFIKPIELKEGKAVFEPDFSYLKTEEGDEPVYLNFTLLTRVPVRYITALQLVAEEEVLMTLEPETRYIDKDGKKWTGRFAGELPPEVLLQLLAAGRKVSFVIQSGDEDDFLFTANRKWEKAAEVLSETLSVEWAERVEK